MPEEKHAANPSTINIRPDVDVILSLNKDYYKGIMEGVFQKLGVKVKGEAKGQENKAAMEVLGLFKNRKLGAKTRYFKNERYSKSLVEIDEHAAYKKIKGDIHRRNDSSKRWLNPSEANDNYSYPSYSTGGSSSSVHSQSPQDAKPPQQASKPTKPPPPTVHHGSGTGISSKPKKKSLPKKKKKSLAEGGAIKGSFGSSRMLAPPPPSFNDNNGERIGGSAMSIQNLPVTYGLPKPKAVICIGDYVIDTEALPSLIQPSNQHKRPAETLPDYFDPSIRPSVPTNNHQVFIPGNKVYARWLNKGDPGSYGTWYPGIIFASQLAPIQDEYNYTGVPNLIYHVKFDDGAESMDLDTEDILMADQYLLWLKEIEQYYSVPVSDDLRWTRLTKNTRVYAKWIDPTDPEIHGSWMSGKVYSSQKWEDGDKQWRHNYHIKFDNGDQDDDLQDGDVVEEQTYLGLMRKKLEGGKKRSRLTGFDLIAEASKLASPIKPINRQCTLVGGAGIKKTLYTEEPAVNDEDILMEELCCNETLDINSPSPTNVARISSTPSPNCHYGIYTTHKPWEVELMMTAAASNGQPKGNNIDNVELQQDVEMKPEPMNGASE